MLSPSVLIEQEIDDMVMMGNDTRIFHTAALESSELDAYCLDESPALEVSVDRIHTLSLNLETDAKRLEQNVRCLKPY